MHATNDGVCRKRRRFEHQLMEVLGGTRRVVYQGRPNGARALANRSFSLGCVLFVTGMAFFRRSYLTPLVLKAER